MRSTSFIRACKVCQIVLSILLVLLGVLFLSLPESSSFRTDIWVGILLIAFGAVKLLGYFSKDLYRLAFQFDLGLGILLILLGLFALFRPERSGNDLSILVGIAVLADALLKIQTALDAKKFGLKTWWLILALSIAAGFSGAWLVFMSIKDASPLPAWIGISILAQGVLNLCVAYGTVQTKKGQTFHPLED